MMSRTLRRKPERSGLTSICRAALGTGGAARRSREPASPR
jgi:hypothetical protein